MQWSFAQPILSIETKISDLGEQFSRKTVDIELKKKKQAIIQVLKGVGGLSIATFF